MTTVNLDLQRAIRGLPGYDPFRSTGGAVFEPERAEFALDFVQECLTFTKGPKAGRPFLLEQWQQAVLGNLWGWRRPDGTRRYRECLIYVPRKNGKTELAAAIVNLEMFTTEELRADLYSAAADREQGRLVFEAVSNMIVGEPVLRRKAELFKYAIVVGANSYKALSSDAGRKHGLSPQLATIDELHAHRNRELVDALMTGVGARPSPLVIHLTTADYEREGSVCNEKHDYACKVRDGVIDDPSFLPVIFEASRDDDWTDPDVWAKTNPNLGVSLQRDYLERECKRAQEDPAYENTFKRLHLNIRTEQAFRWMALDKWDACGEAVDPEALAGRECFAGLDLATVSDMAALVLVFPDETEETFDVLPFFWCPEESAASRERKDRQPYVTWARQGFVELTEGNTIDYRHIRRRVQELGERYAIREIAFDPYNATHLAQQLGEEDGFEMIQFRQGTLSMNEPMKMVMRLVLERKIRHGGHPVLRWNASNIAARKDASDNLRPDKEKSAEKIDGMVALIMAIGRATLGGDDGFSDVDQLLQV